MGSTITKSNSAWRQQYSSRTKDEDYQNLQIFRNEQGETILIKQIQSSQRSDYHEIHSKLQKRRKYTKFVYHIKHFFQQSQYLCSNHQRCIITCKKPRDNLKHLFNIRKQRRIRFTLGEIHTIINNISLALQSLASSDGKLNYLDMNKIVMDDTIYLLDPFMDSQERFGLPFNKYSSPQQMSKYNKYNQIQNHQLLQRIFSLGIICLQICNPYTEIHQQYCKINQQNQQYIDKLFLLDKISQIKDNYLRNKLNIMLNLEPNKRLQIFCLIERQNNNCQPIRVLNHQLRSYSSQCSDKSNVSEATNSRIVTVKSGQIIDNFLQRKRSLQSKSNKPTMKNHQQKLLVNIGLKNDRISQIKPLPLRQTQQHSFHKQNRIINGNNPLSNVPTNETKLKKKTIVKFVNKEPQYKIKINEIKRIQNENKENMPNNSKNNKDNSLNSPFQIQNKNQINIQNTPIKQKKKHYFSTIKEVTENEDCYSEERVKQACDLTLSGRFQGDLISGMKNGKGIFYFTEGCVYDGEWKDNKMNGFGKLFYPNGKMAYEGQWLNNEFNGYGKVYNDNPKHLSAEFFYKDFNKLQEQWVYYEGTLVQDKKEGKGIFYLSNNQYYKGNFINDKIQGQGIYYTLSGQIIKGIWKDNILQKQIL